MQADDRQKSLSGLGNFIRGAASWLPPSLSQPFGRPAALFFHGVEPGIDDPRVQTNHHRAAEFARIAKCLRDNFDVLPLSVLPDVLRQPQRNKRAVFLMSDDGYLNTLTNAADVLAGFELPWTIFVSTQHIDTSERSPIFIARLFILFAPDGPYDIPHLGHVVLGGDRNDLAHKLGHVLKSLDAASAGEAIAAMREGMPDLQELLERFHSDAFLSWDQVRELKQRGVEIGAHAHTHWAMHGRQSLDYVRQQASLSRARVAAEVGACRYFAYPFGNTQDVSRHAWEAVRDAGFKYGFTTLSGTLDASTNPWLMPRYGLRAQEPRLASTIASLRMGNARLTSWQKVLAG
jgi:peptidoglycan/xylan/chitin deacetylase (PgdA/CDA1 family)